MDLTQEDARRLFLELRDLVACAAGMNTRQHAGMRPTSGDWSRLYEHTNRAHALLDSIRDRETA